MSGHSKAHVPVPLPPHPRTFLCRSPTAAPFYFTGGGHHEAEPPVSFLCPITQDIMVDPVMVFACPVSHKSRAS